MSAIRSTTPSEPDIKTDFVIGQDNFDDLVFNPALGPKLRYIYNNAKQSPVKRFILADGQRVSYVCQVSLIEKDGHCEPRLAFSVRDKKQGKISAEPVDEIDVYRTKASFDLKNCHKQFWELISYLQSLSEIDVPKEKFSLVSQQESEIVLELRQRGASSVSSIVKQLLSTPDVSLSHEDINQILKRKEKLAEFEDALQENWIEPKWQDFFDENKWIFGYGLNYQVLRHLQSQPHYGGTRVDGRGGKKGDYLVSSVGAVNFTVLVEIKTPRTPLLQGSCEIRSGAWSLSKDLSDALSQIQACIDEWDKHGAEQRDNRDRLEGSDVYTVQPKGIIVIGSLNEVKTGSDAREFRSKRETFQRFRKSIHGIDIITFDELYQRAKFIVGDQP